MQNELKYIPLFYRENKELLKIKSNIVSNFFSNHDKVNEESLFAYSIILVKRENIYYGRLVLNSEDIESPIVYEKIFGQLKTIEEIANCRGFFKFLTVLFEEKHKYCLEFDGAEMTEKQLLNKIQLWKKTI